MFMSPDLHTTSGKIEDLRERIDEAVHAGSDRAREKQHAKGKGTARERIEMLVDADSFTEIDAVSYTHLTLPTNREV